MAKLRSLLIGEEWDGVQECIDSLEPVLGSLHESAAAEVARARQELSDIGEELEDAIIKAMASGKSNGSARDTRGFWDHSQLEVEPLKKAHAALSGYPLKGPNADGLLSKGAAILSLREALYACAWGQLARVLSGLTGELAQLDEVKAGQKEFEEMRVAVENELKEALMTGRTQKVTASKKTVVFSTKQVHAHNHTTVCTLLCSLFLTLPSRFACMCSAVLL